MKMTPKTIQLRRVRLDASTVCQLKCPACPTASGETAKGIGAGFLKFEDFKNFVDRNPAVSHIELSNWGEVFLNKDLIRIIQYAYQENVAIYIANGANLNTVREEALEALVKYKVREMTCSIDGASQETYSIYRVKGNFDSVIRNIKTINQWKARHRSPYPALKWQFVAFGHNEHEITQARKMAEELKMDFFLKLSWGDLYTQDFSPIKDAELIRRESGLGVKDRNEFREKFGEDYIERMCCRDLWVSPQINYDGRVLGCPVNYWGDYGNAFRDGLAGCLNGDPMNYARDMLMGRREAKAGIPCSRCKVYSRMEKDNSWMTEGEVRGVHVTGRKYVMLENKFLGKELTFRLAKCLNKGRTYLWSVRQALKSVVAGDIQGSFKRGSREDGSTLPGRICFLPLPLLPDLEEKWKPYPLFRGAAKSVRDFSCHASMLVKGHIPHPPHTHKEEEILIMLGGEADLILPELKNERGTDRLRLKPGQFVYYPAGFPHTLQAVSEPPANYLMFKWYKDRRFSPGLQENGQLKFGHFNTVDPADKVEAKGGFAARLLLEGPTQCLKKIHAHTSRLAPGGGYKPHVDPYDVVILVREGEVETWGQTAGPHSVIFYPAGKPHGIVNPGSVTAKYAVFEFHGD